MALGLSAAQMLGARAIIQAYNQMGVNPIGGLAVALNESGLNPTATGDNGSSYGLFQLHRGGALPSSWSAQQAYNPLQNAMYAARQIAAGAHGMNPAQTQAYQTMNFERPANPAGDMNPANLARAAQIYAQLSGSAPLSAADLGSTGMPMAPDMGGMTPSGMSQEDAIAMLGKLMAQNHSLENGVIPASMGGPRAHTAFHPPNAPTTPPGPVSSGLQPPRGMASNPFASQLLNKIPSAPPGM